MGLKLVVNFSFLLLEMKHSVSALGGLSPFCHTTPVFSSSSISIPIFCLCFHLLLFPPFPLSHTLIWTSSGASSTVANIFSFKHVLHFRCGTQGTTLWAVVSHSCWVDIPPASWLYSVYFLTFYCVIAHFLPTKHTGTHQLPVYDCLYPLPQISKLEAQLK